MINRGLSSIAYGMTRIIGSIFRSLITRAIIGIGLVVYIFLFASAGYRETFYSMAYVGVIENWYLTMGRKYNPKDYQSPIPSGVEKCNIVLLEKCTEIPLRFDEFIDSEIATKFRDILDNPCQYLANPGYIDDESNLLHREWRKKHNNDYYWNQFGCGSKEPDKIKVIVHLYNQDGRILYSLIKEDI